MGPTPDIRSGILCLNKEMGHAHVKFLRLLLFHLIAGLDFISCLSANPGTAVFYNEVGFHQIV